MQDDKKNNVKVEDSVKNNNAENSADLMRTDSEPKNDKQQPKTPSEDSVTWTASEYIHHEKSANWFLGLSGVTILLALAVYFIFRDLISTITVLFCGLVFGVFASRTPKDMQFSVGETEIFIGKKDYSYGEFRSYARSNEGGMQTIILYPMKRFETLKTIYCAPEMIDQIEEIIASQLPVDEHQPDAIERLMQKVRF
jgi:hypothetical protein